MSLNFKPWIVWPMNTTGPFDEISRRMARPSVVLPEPDLADHAERLALAHLEAHAVHRLDVADHLAHEAALDREPDLEILGRHHHRRVRPRRRRIGLRLGGEQGARIGVLGRAEDALDRTALDDLALLHHADPVGQLAHDAEVVGDEQHRHAEPDLCVLERLRGSAPARSRRARWSARRRSAGPARWPAPWRSSRAGAARRRAGAGRLASRPGRVRMPPCPSESMIFARACVAGRP